jgi:hypothetical protein
MKKCANCHTPKERIIQPFDTLSCSKECDQDLSDMLDGVSYDKIKTRGRTVECSVLSWCGHCASEKGKS